MTNLNCLSLLMLQAPFESQSMTQIRIDFQELKNLEKQSEQQQN